MNTIKLSKSNNIAYLELNRPEVHNAFNAEMIQELTEVFSYIGETEKNLLAIVIQGAGKSFSAGADLNYMKEMAGYSAQENEDDSKRLFDLFEAVYCCLVPVIAKVHGAAFGGANGLIAAADYAICTHTAKFAFSEVKLGLLPATISPFVIRKIGEANARDLLLTGRRFSGTEAFELGLANLVVKEEELVNAVESYLAEYRAAAPAAVRNTKKLIRQISNNQVLNIKDHTAHLIAEARASQEGKEGINAFFEKRKPKWNE